MARLQSNKDATKSGAANASAPTITLAVDGGPSPSLLKGFGVGASLYFG